MLRMAMCASSTRLCTRLTNSRRRSSVKGGMGRRIILPSLLGVSPRSDLRIAFFIFVSSSLSRSLIIVLLHAEESNREAMPLYCFPLANECADILAAHDALDAAGLPQVHHYDGQVVFHAQGDRGHIHHAHAQVE